MTLKSLIIPAVAIATMGSASPTTAQPTISPAATRAIAEEALLYGFPMIMNYGVMYAYAVDTNSGQYKAPFNQIYNTANVYTPADTAVITPNSDTPYSTIFMDLRAEPVVICVSEIEKTRYYTVQLVDMYTANYGYIGSRTTGNDAGCYMVSGPDWKGRPPYGIKQVFRSETGFSAVAIRTQLFGPSDLDNVRKVQAGYKTQTLSQFLHQPAPPAAPAVAFPKIDKELARANPFAYLNFVLQFCPPVSQERALRAKFASIGIEAGKPFDPAKLSPERKTALIEGEESGMAQIKKASFTLGTDVNGWRMGLNGGNRAYYNGDWLRRAAIALAGIYANDAAEALYPTTHTDRTSAKLDGTTGSYSITFPAGQLPPVNAFWSVTMYDGKTQLLIANPIDRYLINSPMLSDLKTNGDGSLTLYVQKDSPGADKASNWLPAPNDEFYMVMRLYWPKQTALNGTWKPPAVQAAK